MQHVALHDEVAVGQARRQLCDQAATLVGQRLRVIVQDRLNQSRVFPIRVPDLFERVEVYPPLLEAVPSVRLAPALGQHPDVMQEIEGLLQREGSNRNVPQFGQGNLADHADLLFDLAGRLLAGLPDRRAEKDRRLQGLARGLDPMGQKQVATGEQRIFEVLLDPRLELQELTEKRENLARDDWVLDLFLGQPVLGRHLACKLGRDGPVPRLLRCPDPRGVGR